MQNFEYISNSGEDTIAFGKGLGKLLDPGDCVVLDGELGAGKTQITKGVAKALGISRDVVSPTFNILIKYDSGLIDLNHFDLYRLEDSGELEDIGYFEVLEDNSITLIEWGLKFPEDMPYSYLLVDVGNIDANTRRITCSAVGKKGKRILSEVKHHFSLCDE
ncbi:MAG: tRNA (adenosine(37)-N6)-threonylcarbamoyltransferase complex ATPase subunit type 1 TsaE [Eggerthellaceae bacterium]|nr:tRNA (adenosine(37)-N6)-threonylcarbamoyltransferase complex ATPase subunit type 1 TsaE [Eggerthellaceae bacterium]